MKALISSIEPVQTGYRVAQVEEDTNIFPVAEGLYWVSCDNNIVADRYWFNPANGAFVEIIITAITANTNIAQPVTQGTQTF
jgi:hypothetical protein